MIYIAGEAAYVGFTINSTTGAATDADSTPTASVRRNGSIDGTVTATVTNNSTGAYTVSFTVPSGWSAGDDVEVLVSATVGGVSAKKWVGKGAVDASISSVKAKTDLIPSSPAEVGSAMTLASNSVTAAALASDAVTEIAAGVASAIEVTPFAVLGIKTTLSGVDPDDYIPAVAGDDKTVGVFFEDGSGNPAPIPSGATAAMLDSAGTEVGTTTVTDSKTQVGYLLIRLEVPSSGARPSVLRVTFAGGSGGAWSHDIPMRVWS